MEPTDCFVLCTLAILKSIRNSLIFFENGCLLMFLAGLKVRNSLASKLASNSRLFAPGSIRYWTS